MARLGDELVLAWCGRGQLTYSPFSNTTLLKVEDGDFSEGDAFSSKV